MFFLIVASLLYAAGGVAMKYSRGFQEAFPSFLVFLFFGIAAAIQTWAMKKVELGRGYLFVTGLEGLFAFLAGVLVFEEALAFYKGLGAVFILVGLILLKL